MKKVLLWILILALLAGGCYGGWYWYRETHIFVEDAVYAKDSQTLDLRGTGISREHFESVQAQLPECQIIWDVPFQGALVSSDTTEMTLDYLHKSDLEMLAYFPQLRRIDATACHNYELLEQLVTACPNAEVIYSISLGTLSVDPATTELTLAPADFDYNQLMTNLAFLPQVSTIRFEETTLSLDQLAALADAYPNAAVSYSVSMAGKTYEMDTAEVDLSAMTSEEISGILSQMAMLPGIQTVELMKADGTSNLTLVDVQMLQETLPDTNFHYTFDFFGKKLSTETERVEFANTKIGNENMDLVRQALDVMDKCTYMLLDNCRFSDQALAELRDDYRDRTKIVWRVWFGDGSCLTDAEVIRSTFDLIDDNCHDLVYCEDVRFIDFGHNEYLDACEFVRGMPNLEFIILSGAPIKDLSPFENCKKLKNLEIAFCHYITDLSPLANCESLEMINIGATQVTDLSPLDDLNITMLMASGGKVSYAEQQRFAQVHPDCWATYSGNQYGSGWRYDKDNQQLPWYQEIAKVFGYPEPKNNAGWYLD